MSRRCQVLSEGQYWRDTPIGDVRAGQVFRMFEADGRPVRDEDGHERWRATSDAVPSGPDAVDVQHRVEAEAIPETDAERQARTGGGFFPTKQSWRGLSARGGSWR